MEYRDFVEQVKEQIQDGAELDDVLTQIASVYQSHYIDHDIDLGHNLLYIKYFDKYDDIMCARMALYFKGLNLRCSAFYYSARTFLESGAVVTDRATAERSKNEYRSSRIQYRFLSCWLS